LYSQFGEHLIIDELITAMNLRSSELIMCEFGAWDGYRYSNLAHLADDVMKMVLIEGEADRFKVLQSNMYNKPSVLCLNYWVRAEGPGSIESIFKEHEIDHLDVISIDIDSDDYQIFESVSDLGISIIICEYNPSIPNDIVITNPEGAQLGCSAKALVDLADTKNYSLVKQTTTNLVFVPTKFMNKLPEKYQNIKISFQDGNFRFFFGYDGTLYRYSNGVLTAPEVTKVPWSAYYMTNPVPRFFRIQSYSVTRNIIAKIVSMIGIVLCRPVSLYKAIESILAKNK